MQRVAVLLLAAAMLPAAGRGQSVIRLKSRTIDPSRTRPAGSGVMSRHLLVQFRGYPGRDVREALARRGVRVLEYVPDNALMVFVPANVDLSDFGLLWAGRLEAADKLSPRLDESTADTAIVVFQRDADMDAARALVAQAGLEVVEQQGLALHHLAVAGGSLQIGRLANDDSVAYILPAEPELRLRRPVFACPGPITEAGPVGEYSLQGSGWTKDAGGALALAYFFDTVTPKLPESTVRSEVERALGEWSRYSNVNFTAGAQQHAARSIDILFAGHAHGDAYPFDGAGGVLAHTFFPAPANTETIAGDMHFDGDENWSVNAGVDLYSVALHEIGHALGLGHSDRPSAVMYPYYRQQTGLTSDDIAAVQALYGVRGAPSPTPSPTPAPAPAPTPPPTPAPSPPAGIDTTSPSVTIVSPAATIVATTGTSIAISGKASDNIGVVKVTWTTSTGGSGTASGTTAWSANVPLLVGDNTITVRAFDAAGNSGWRAITVVRY